MATASTTPLLIRKRSVLASCLSGRTVFFAGSSFARTMVVGFLEELTKQKQSTHIESRDGDSNSCRNLDGYDIANCGWPRSKWWLVERQKQGVVVVVDEAKYMTPPQTHEFPPTPGPGQWLIVFQFKTFVSTPELDADLIRQVGSSGYKADLLVIETGIWGYLSWLGSVEEQTSTFLQTIQTGYTASNVIVITDGFHQGMIGPHVVNGSVASTALGAESGSMGFIHFDRTMLLHNASRHPDWAVSMSSHGYAGAVSNMHALILFSFMCAVN